MSRHDRSFAAQPADRRFARLPPPPVGFSLAVAVAIVVVAQVLLHPLGPVLLGALMVSAIFVAWRR